MSCVLSQFIFFLGLIYNDTKQEAVESSAFPDFYSDFIFPRKSMQHRLQRLSHKLKSCFALYSNQFKAMDIRGSLSTAFRIQLSGEVSYILVSCHWGTNSDNLKRVNSLLLCLRRFLEGGGMNKKML